MKTLQNVPEKIRRGELVVNGHSVMAFLADFREDGAEFDAENIIEAAGAGDDLRRSPPAFINANRAYLDELARVSRCSIDALIGLRRDGRYWCVHQVAVRLAGWVSPKLQVVFDRALIQFAKNYMARSFEWIDKRDVGRQVNKHFADWIDSDIETPHGKEDGLKYGVLHKAINGPFNSAQGGPSDTKTFNEINKVSAAMDAYDTPYIVGATLARSVTIANSKRKGIHELNTAKNEAEDNAKQIADLTVRLLNKQS